MLRVELSDGRIRRGAPLHYSSILDTYCASSMQLGTASQFTGGILVQSIRLWMFFGQCGKFCNAFHTGPLVFVYVCVCEIVCAHFSCLISIITARGRPSISFSQGQGSTVRSIPPKIRSIISGAYQLSKGVWMNKVAYYMVFYRSTNRADLPR